VGVGVRGHINTWIPLGVCLPILTASSRCEQDERRTERVS